jgi:hypothetical protein
MRLRIDLDPIEEIRREEMDRARRVLAGYVTRTRSLNIEEVQALRALDAQGNVGQAKRLSRLRR